MLKTLRQRKKELRGPTYKPLKSGKFHYNGKPGRPMTRKRTQAHRREVEGAAFPRRLIREGSVASVPTTKKLVQGEVGVAKIFRDHHGLVVRCPKCNEKIRVEKSGSQKCFSCDFRFSARS